MTRWGDPFDNLGILFFDREQYRAAEQAFRQAIERSPETGSYHANLASSLLALDRRGDALAAAKRAIELGYKGPHVVFEALNLKP